MLSRYYQGIIDRYYRELVTIARRAGRSRAMGARSRGVVDPCTPHREVEEPPDTVTSRVVTQEMTVGLAGFAAGYRCDVDL